MRNALHFVMVLAAALALGAGSIGCREQSEGDKQLEEAASGGAKTEDGGEADDEAMDEAQPADAGGGEGETSGADTSGGQ